MYPHIRPGVLVRDPELDFFFFWNFPLNIQYVLLFTHLKQSEVPRFWGGSIQGRLPIVHAQSGRRRGSQRAKKLADTPEDPDEGVLVVVNAGRAFQRAFWPLHRPSPMLALPNEMPEPIDLWADPIDRMRLGSPIGTTR